MSYIVEIGDSAGQAFKIKLEVPIIRASAGYWQTVDKGYIRFNSGTTDQVKSTGTFATMHVLLVDCDNLWGLRLNEFCDFWGPNKTGNGLLLSSWALTAKPDVISWIVVSTEADFFPFNH